jgi:Uncharacterised nucleotidyltransferase
VIADVVRDCVREREAPAQQGADTAWPVLVDTAVRHRVAEYVLRAGLDLPEGVAHQLRTESLAAQALVMLLDAELERVSQTFDGYGVPVVVLKGPGLARTIYPDRALRPYSDLDLNIHAEDEARAVAALRECGYRELEPDQTAMRPGHTAPDTACAPYHRQFAGSAGRVLIELHLDGLQLGVTPIGETQRWARAQALPGVPGALMLGPTDQLVELCVHAQKHGYSRLIWLKDLDLLVRRRGAHIDWPLVTRIARAEGVTASVWYALRLTRIALGTPLPDEVHGLRPGFVIRKLYALVWPAARIVNLAGLMHRRAVQFHLADSWRGTVPSMVLLGRRPVRARLLARALWRQVWLESSVQR